MPIRPLQLPDPLVVPRVDFSPLVAIGQNIGNRRREDADRAAESAAFGGVVDALQGTTPPAPQELPRGLRNNNPGNIEDGPLAKSLPGYKGVEPDGPYGKGRFAVFDTPENGMGAHDALLLSYSRRGLKTARDIATRWAPKSDKDPNNDPEAYASYIGGGDPDKVLDLNNPEERKRIVQAMGRWENGMHGGAPQSAAGMPPELAKKVRALYDVGTPRAVEAATELVSRFMPGGSIELARAKIEDMRQSRQLERDKLDMPVVVGNANTGYYLVDRRGKRIVEGPPQPEQPAPAEPAATTGPDGQPVPAQPAQQPAQPAPQAPQPTGAQPIVPGKPGKLAVIPGGKGDPNLLLSSPQNRRNLVTWAAQAKAGDTSVFTSVGRGGNGEANLITLRGEMARQNDAHVEDDKEEEWRTHGIDQAMRNAEYLGLRAGQRVMGARVANIELAATEFLKVAPIVEQASAAVSRTQYPDINKLINAYKEKTGDPAVIRLGGAINTAVNVYARAVAPTGAGTVSDKDHARELLQRAYAAGQISGQIQLMKQEIDAALEAPADVRDAWRKRFKEGNGVSVLDKPGTGGGTSAAAPKKIAPEDATLLKREPTPERRRQFDAVYGAGEADKILGPAR
jgi:hypothetical protein